MRVQYQRTGNRVYTVNYHIVFCPKYRRKCLVDAVAKRVDALIRQKTSELKCEVIALEVMCDHVHLFVATTPDIAPNRIVCQVKGITSHICRQEFPHLLKMPSLWTRSYFLSTVGYVSATIVEAYIANQKGK